MQQCLDRTGQFHVPLQRSGRVHGHIGPGLDVVLQAHAGTRAEHCAAARRHRVAGIVDEEIRRLVARRGLARQPAIPAHAVGVSAAMQVESGVRGSCERPFPLVAPHLLAHHVNAQRCRERGIERPPEQQLRRQKRIVPTGLQQHRRPDRLRPVLENGMRTRIVGARCSVSGRYKSATKMTPSAVAIVNPRCTCTEYSGSRIPSWGRMNRATSVWHADSEADGADGSRDFDNSFADGSGVGE